ncbi:MAG TPA: hypothetical protein VNL71_18755, partial [Chloroflexota bacterium]|nr:hypothetical protein [Chloroflexota bacterium]
SANSGEVSATPSNAAAAYLGPDTTTQGNWKGVYGADGYDVFEDSASLPAYAALTPDANKRDYTWSSSPTDTRALERATTGRIAACWYNPSSYTMDLNLTDGQPHEVTLYFLDWEPEGRSELIDILDANNGSTLDSRTVSSFSGGVYLTWTITGHVTISLNKAGDPATNTVCSGIFFAGAVPTGLVATAGNGQVSLIWNPRVGVTGYYVYRGTSAGGESGTPLNTTTSASYLDTTVTNGVTYYYVVQWVNAVGPSGNSNEAHATPEGAGALVDNPPPGWAADIVPTDSSDAGGAGPSASESVDLSSGVEQSSPGADLTAYNPVGPSVDYTRMYRSSLAQAEYGSPGLSPGWVDNYDESVTQDPNTGNLLLHYPNGGQETCIVNGDGTISPPSGAPYLAAGVFVSGAWQSLTMTFGD